MMPMPMPIFIPSSSSTTPNVIHRPGPDGVKALIRKDIIQGGDTFGEPTQIRYVSDIGREIDIKALRELNNQLNTDAERWKPRYDAMVNTGLKITVAGVTVSTLLGTFTGGFSIYAFTPGPYPPVGIIEMTVGTIMGTVSTACVVANYYMIKTYVHTRFYETPEIMMENFRRKYDAAFQDELNVRYLE